MYGTYCRLDVHVHASAREVIKAARLKLKKAARTSRASRIARHAFFREMLEYHSRAREQFAAHRF